MVDREIRRNTVNRVENFVATKRMWTKLKGGEEERMERQGEKDYDEMRGAMRRNKRSKRR